MLLHLRPNVITFRTLLHLGPNVITFRTLLHLGQLLHLGLQHAFGCHTLVSPTNRKDLQFFVLSCFHTSLDRTLDILFVLSEFCKYGSRGLFTFLFHLLKTSLLFPFLIKQIEHYQRS